MCLTGKNSATEELEGKKSGSDVDYEGGLGRKVVGSESLWFAAETRGEGGGVVEVAQRWRGRRLFGSQRERARRPAGNGNVRYGRN